MLLGALDGLWSHFERFERISGDRGGFRRSVVDVRGFVISLIMDFECFSLHPIWNTMKYIPINLLSIYLLSFGIQIEKLISLSYSRILSDQFNAASGFLWNLD